jgi:DNA-binding IclR family transcriptional regulator
MNETDDAILEFFAELASVGFRIWLAPTPVWLNLTQQLGALEKSRDTVSRRMGLLVEMGLLERVDEKRGYYRITDKGMSYVAGELAAEDIPPPDQ